MKDGWKAKETFDPSGNAAAAPLTRNLEDLLSWPEDRGYLVLIRCLCLRRVQGLSAGGLQGVDRKRGVGEQDRDLSIVVAQQSDGTPTPRLLRLSPHPAVRSTVRTRPQIPHEGLPCRGPSHQVGPVRTSTAGGKAPSLRPPPRPSSRAPPSPSTKSPLPRPGSLQQG